LGDAPHAFKLDDPEFMNADAEVSEEGTIFKEGLGKLVEKMEVISKHCLNQRKYKEESKKRIEHLESQAALFVSKEMFHSEMEKLESRMVDFVKTNHKKLTEEVTE
jgi:hypothetical protein